MSQQSKVGRVHTRIHKGKYSGFTYVTYHSTDVVTFDDKHIRLRTGGWHTATTRLRMNQASNQFGLSFRVFQKDWTWYVTYKGNTVPFVENMQLER